MTDVEGMAGPDPAGGDPDGAPEPAAPEAARDGSSGVPRRIARPGATSGAAAAAQLAGEVFRQSLDAIIVTDPDDRIRAWNPAAGRLFGIVEADAIGRTSGELWSSFEVDGRPIEGPGVRARGVADGSWRGRVVQRPLLGEHAGEEVIVDAVATLLRDDTGEISGIFVVNRDVTTSARLEAETATLGSLVIATDRARSKSEVAEAAIEILCRATGADAGLVTSVAPAYEATARRGLTQRTIDVIVGRGQISGPLAAALQPSDAFINADVVTAPLREDVRAAVIDEGIVHLQVVGLRLSGRLLGLVALGWRHPVPNPPSKTILLQAAALIAAAVENARLIEAVEHGLVQERKLTRRFRALVELTRLPDTAPTDGLGIERLVAEIGEIVGADGSIFARVAGDLLNVIATDRVDPDRVQSLLDRPLAGIGIAARLGAAEHAFVLGIDRQAIGPLEQGETHAAGYRSLVAFPIRESGQLSGALISLFERPLEELDIDDRTLEAIGRVLEISLVNRGLRQVVAASEARYRALFERLPYALLVETPDGGVVDANPAARRLFGGDLVGRQVDALVVGKRLHVDPGSNEFRRYGVMNHVGVGRRLDGSTFPEEVDLHPLEIDGEPQVLAIVRDMTERTRLQAELIQAQKMEAIGLLVAGVAHELNNPLASIVAFSQLIRTDPELPEELQHQADMLVQEANRTRVIVQNLLDFARATPPERGLTELRPLVDSVIGLQSYSFGKGGLEVVIDIPTDLPPLSLDRSQVQQVLINLTVNAAQAIRAAGRGGTVRIAATTASLANGERVVRIEVSDDGPGVPAELVDRLFMPFVTSKAPGLGTGLGLSVSFGIITGHGGTLRHRPGPGGVGATFVIELPLRGKGAGGLSDLAAARIASGPAPGTDIRTLPPAGRPIARAARAVPAAVAAVASPSVPSRRPAAPSLAAAGLAEEPDRPLRVLVLDDETSIREFLGRALVRAGYEPMLAPTGTIALEMIRHDPPDAILCDHRMAGMNGTEFHDAVAAAAPTLGHRFAFMSGDVLNPELRAFATARGILLLAKPFDIATVGRTVAALLGSAPVA